MVHHPDVLLCSGDLPSLPQLPASAAHTAGRRPADAVHRKAVRRRHQHQRLPFYSRHRLLCGVLRCPGHPALPRQGLAAGLSDHGRAHQPVYRIPQAALRSGCAGGAGCLRRSLSPDLSGTCRSRFSDPRRRSWPKAVPGAGTPLAFPTLSLYNRGTEFFCRIAPFSNDTA